MGAVKLPKGERHEILHRALLEELGSGAKLTMKQAFRLFKRFFDVETRPSFYNHLDAMDLEEMVEWDRSLDKAKNTPCITVLPLESGDELDLAAPGEAA